MPQSVTPPVSSVSSTPVLRRHRLTTAAALVAFAVLGGTLAPRAAGAGQAVDTVSAAPSAGTNLLANGGFEGTYVDGVAPGWKRWLMNDHCVATPEESNSVKRSGSRAQLLHMKEQFGGYLVVSSPIRGGIVKGQDYEARVWVKAERHIQTHLDFIIHSKKDRFPDIRAVRIENATQTWQEVVLQFRAKVDDPDAHFGIKLGREGRLSVDDAVVRKLVPDPDAVPQSGNLLRNSSFEVGLHPWYVRNNKVAYAVTTDTSAPHGSKVVKLLSEGGHPNCRLETATLPGVYGAHYTFSGHFRRSTPGNVRVVVRELNNVIAEQVLPVGTEWERRSFSFEMPPLPSGRFHLQIYRTVGADLSIDGLQLEAGKAELPAPTAYKPAAPVEVGLAVDDEDAVIDAGKPVTGKLLVYNDTDAPKRLDLRHRVFDLLERPWREEKLALDVPAKSSEHALTFTPRDQRGSFRAQVDVADDTRLPYGEAVFTLLGPVPAPDPFFGVTADSSSRFAAMTGSGLAKGWNFHWGSINPRDGEWNWKADPIINRWSGHGFAYIGVLSEAAKRYQDLPENPSTFAWYPCTDLKKMEEYARRCAERYGDRVAAWDLQNEPDVALSPRSEKRGVVYAREALALAKGVRASRPDARLLLGGGTTTHVEPAEWFREAYLAEPELKTLTDSVSYHCYNPLPEVTRRIVGRTRQLFVEMGFGPDGKRIYDTEWLPNGAPGSHLRLFTRYVPFSSAPARETTTQLIQGSVTRRGEGLAGSVLYVPNASADVLGKFDFFEDFDGKPRPNVAALNVMITFLKGATNPRAGDQPGAFGYLFDRAGDKPLYVAWADDAQTGPVTIKLPAAARATDFMGNPLGRFAADAAVQVGHEPVYFVLE